MKISKISVFQVDLPFDKGVYRLSGGRTWTAMDSTIVRIETDDGLMGWGETCPFGPNYLEAFSRGARAGIAELAPSLIGLNPSLPSVVLATMDRNLLGHPYVKHAIDMACWDLLGKHADQPLYKLFGGRLTETVPVAGGIPIEHGSVLDKRLAVLRQRQCKQFSCKASGDIEIDIGYINVLGDKLEPGESIKFDANGGWRVDEAIRVMRATSKIDIYFEQPCASFEECKIVRQSCGRPIVLDECALNLTGIMRAWNEGICDAVNLKIGRVGGLSRSMEIRNLCVSLGVPVYIQCSGGSSITQAAIVHLAHSTPAKRLLSIWDIGDLASFSTVSNPILQRDGKMQVDGCPGLGVEPDPDVLGQPIAEYP